MATQRRSGAVDQKPLTHRRLNVQLREDSLQRLMLHAVMTRKSPGEILTDLVDQNLRQWRVQENPKRQAMSPISVDLAVPVESPAEIAATAA